MTHAMLLVGVYVGKDGMPVRYRVENSWSDTAGTKGKFLPNKDAAKANLESSGYFVCTSSWFKEHVFQIVCPKKLAPPELVKIYETGKPVALPCYDPMGALA